MNDRRLHIWARPGLGGSRCWPCSTNCSIHKPLALGANQCAVSPFCIFNSKFGAVGVRKSNSARYRCKWASLTWK